ncbi:hypothetical protein A3A64_03630 [Candidatus Gottesmanbacteria bacterium RIFCSPLOWO2_01_FULL_48_11]|uniref:Uncharacterized protein n=1 Tax=Candidatus Gottesmanbacteria bacterium RIFCSPLOWO2_01_FULL_48_11 TaxID=1798395 RepID=A0A1F6AV84_9BACT|nr:MAG: hypothetical protein A3A64_03630 [Candidatus Gottesmanbacteria bacterium RIFCSPLOWO2_01_FULL_48_11]
MRETDEVIDIIRSIAIESGPPDTQENIWETREVYNQDKTRRFTLHAFGGPANGGRYYWNIGLEATGGDGGWVQILRVQQARDEDGKLTYVMTMEVEDETADFILRDVSYRAGQVDTQIVGHTLMSEAWQQEQHAQQVVFRFQDLPAHIKERETVLLFLEQVAQRNFDKPVLIGDVVSSLPSNTPSDVT